MNKPFIGGIVVALAVLVAGGAFVVAPRLQSPRDKVFAKSGEHTERARRLLRRFSQNQQRIEGLLEALSWTGVTAEDDDMERLLEDRRIREAVDEESTHLRKLIRKDLGKNVNQQSRKLSKGLQERERLLTENRKLLDEALREVNLALAVTEGDAGGQEDIQANRLKGVILYYLAQSKHLRADFLRQEEGGFRGQLAGLAFEASGLADEKNLVANSRIELHIEAAERDVAEAEGVLTGLEAQADAAQADVDAIKSRMTKLRAVADEARAAMDSMRTHGVDLAEAQGSELFAEEFNELARVYRQAVSELHTLEFGTLRNARIDSSGDLLKGQYVPVERDQPIEIDHGLTGRESDLGQILLKVVAARQRLESARSLRDGLVTRKNEYQQRGRQADAQMAELANSASEMHTKFRTLSEKVEEAESAAIGYYVQSARAFGSASRLAATRAREADAAMTGQTPEARERSPNNLIAADAWFEQQYRVNAADAQIALGRLHYTISEEAARTHKVLAALPEGIVPEGMDAAVWLVKHGDAREQGLEALHTAYDSLQGTRGALRGHWTIAAQAAAAANLIALMGEEGFRDIATEIYKEVISGYEDEPQMQSYLNRLRVLNR